MLMSVFGLGWIDSLLDATLVMNAFISERDMRGFALLSVDAMVTHTKPCVRPAHLPNSHQIYFCVLSVAGALPNLLVALVWTISRSKSFHWKSCMHVVQFKKDLEITTCVKCVYVCERLSVCSTFYINASTLLQIIIAILSFSSVHLKNLWQTLTLYEILK